jgi:hypothetical protein
MRGVFFVLSRSIGLRGPRFFATYGKSIENLTPVAVLVPLREWDSADSAMLDL